jgi:hypothetical protein
MTDIQQIQELNAFTTRIGHLLTITKNGTEYRFQNFLHNQDYSYGGKIYEFAPINYTVPGRSLDLENNQTKLTLPNFPEILTIVEQNDGFRDAIVQAICIFPDNLNATPYAVDIMTARSAKIVGSAIEFDLQSPFSAVDGLFPSIYFTTGTSEAGLGIVGFLPEVPLVARVDLN